MRNLFLQSILSCVVAVSAVAQTMVETPNERTGPWDSRIVDAFSAIPVQHEGRVKPLDTLVQFTLYPIHQKRKVHLPDEREFGAAAGTALRPMQWGLDMMFFPRWADEFPVFTVTDSNALETVGLSDVVKRKRDRYSYLELRPGLDQLNQKLREFGQIEPKQRTLLQSQITGLGESVFHHYLPLNVWFDFARATIRVPEEARDFYGDVEFVRMSEALRQLFKIAQRYSNTDAPDGIRRFVEEIRFYAQRADTVQWITPAEGEKRWLTLWDLEHLAELGAVTEDQLGMVARAEAFVDALGDEEAAAAAAIDLHQHAAKLADARGQYEKIEMEVGYYRADYFYNALMLFVAGFLVLCVSWFLPTHRWPGRLAFAAVGVGNVVVITGIAVRCVVRDRPPITGIYDTILFISGVVVLVAMIAEWITKKRVALVVASLMGALGMFLSFKHEMITARDTMPNLVAVLDTNFWLSTHVTTVTMGYAAGMLAAGLAWVFVLGKLFGLRRGDYGFYHSLGKMVYGTIAFGVVFATVGTILGGVWANDSWGRFWGWDPKENGALMIVLWMLIMLHARMAGYVRHWGFCLMAIPGSMIVAFSWWGVNLLGVGLHSYGFTSGIDFALNIFYGSSIGVFCLGVFARWLDKRRTAVAAVEDAVPGVSAAAPQS